MDDNKKESLNHTEYQEIVNELQKPNESSTNTVRKNQIFSTVTSIIVFALVALVYFLFLHDNGGLKEEVIYSYSETQCSVTILSGDMAEDEIKSEINGYWTQFSYSFKNGVLTENKNDTPSTLYNYTLIENTIFVYEIENDTEPLKQFTVDGKNIFNTYEYANENTTATVTIIFSR